MSALPPPIVPTPPALDALPMAPAGAPLESQPIPPPRLPLVLQLVLGVVVTAGGAAAGLLPSPWGWVLTAIVLLASWLAGVRVAVPAFVIGRPVVRAAIAGPLAVLGAQLVELGAVEPEGLARSLLLVAALVCAGLAGVPIRLPAVTRPQAGGPTSGGLGH